MSKPNKKSSKKSPKPAPTSLATFLVRIWPAQAKAVRAAAKKRGVSLSEFLRTAIIRSAAGSVSVPECPKIKRGRRDATVASKPKAKKATPKCKAVKRASKKQTAPKRSHHKKPAVKVSVVKPIVALEKEAANG